MDDMPTVLLSVIGACVAAVAVFGLAKRGHEQPLVPIIQRRNELREELAELLGDEEGGLLLREVATREGRPAFEIAVLEKAVERAKERVRRRESEAAQAQPHRA